MILNCMTRKPSPAYLLNGLEGFMAGSLLMAPFLGIMAPSHVVNSCWTRIKPSYDFSILTCVAILFDGKDMIMMIIIVGVW